MQHRDIKDAGKEVCDDLRDLVQTELSKLPEITSQQLPTATQTGKAGKDMKNCV